MTRFEWWTALAGMAAYCLVAAVAWGWRMGVLVAVVTLCGYVIGRARGSR